MHVKGKAEKHNLPKDTFVPGQKEPCVQEEQDN